MKRFFLLLAFISPLLVLGPGCFGPKKPKESNTIAADIEAEFRQRWVARRMGELTASGVTDGRKAREQAMKEFAEKYGYTSAGKAYSRP